MVPLIINPIYTLYHVGISWGPFSLLKGSLGTINQQFFQCFFIRSQDLGSPLMKMGSLGHENENWKIDDVMFSYDVKIDLLPENLLLEPKNVGLVHMIFLFISG